MGSAGQLGPRATSGANASWGHGKPRAAGNVAAQASWEPGKLVFVRAPAQAAGIKGNYFWSEPSLGPREAEARWDQGNSGQV